MTPAEYRARFGVEPQQDDLHRAGCEQAGDVGHLMCGICPIHQRPRFMCGCAHTSYLQNFHAPVLEVSHASLTRCSDRSDFKSFCPACTVGYLLVYRNQKTGKLQPDDRCTRCAQRVRYTDEGIGCEKFER